MFFVFGLIVLTACEEGGSARRDEGVAASDSTAVSVAEQEWLNRWFPDPKYRYVSVQLAPECPLCLYSLENEIIMCAQAQTGCVFFLRSDARARVLRQRVMRNSPSLVPFPEHIIILGDVPEAFQVKGMRYFSYERIDSLHWRRRF